MTWLDGPLAGFDLETTGVDVNEDRIVTACVGYGRQAGDWIPTAWIVNPGVEIPEAATAVHGISTEQARLDGVEPGRAVEQIDRMLQEVWNLGAPVIGYNVCYDLTLLDRECRRHLGRPFQLGGPVIDALVLDKAVDQFRRGSRKLTAVCDHYGIPLGDEAHNADADALAAVRLAWAIASGPDFPPWDLERLYQWQVQQYASQRTSFFLYLARKGEKPDDHNTVWPIAPLPAEAERSVA